MYETKKKLLFVRQTIPVEQLHSVQYSRKKTVHNIIQNKYYTRTHVVYTKCIISSFGVYIFQEYGFGLLVLDYFILAEELHA